MNEYTFPFSTCETPNKYGIAQHYSALTNLVNCIIIFYFLTKTKTRHSFVLLFSILCFELFHMFSHIYHITGPIQTNIVHFLAYFINIGFFYSFYSYTKKWPDIWFTRLLLAIIVFDIYALVNLSLMFYILSQVVLLISLLFYYYPLMPKEIQKSIYYVVFFVCIILLSIYNEKINCKAMLQYNPKFPYHIFIEITGIFLFYVICKSFYKL